MLIGYGGVVAPAEAVSKLYPQIYPGTVQNLEIMESQAASVSGGMQATAVHYHYLDQGQQQIEGAVLVITLPPTYTPLLNYWTIIALGGEGPAALFQQDKAIYIAILNSLTYNQKVLQEQVRQPFDRMWENDPVYQKRMDNLIAVLGASDTYVGTDGSTHTLNNVPPLHTLKQWYENLWWCGGNIYKIAGIKPDTACIRLDPAIQ